MKNEKKETERVEESKATTLGPDDPGPRLEEVDDSARGRFKPTSRGDVGGPQIVEVEFRQDSQSGVHTDRFDPRERKEYSEEWSDELRSVLQAHSLETWKPSFPLRYAWSKESADSARQSYEASGRDKFVTFNFPRDSETRGIAAELRKLPEIRHAVAVPRIAPPAGPLDEPLIGASDQLMNTVCRPDGCLQNQWYIFRAHVDRAWANAQASGKDVIIADIDWGFRPDHEELYCPLTKHMFSDLPDNGIVSHGDWTDHGTAVLGLAGARVNTLGMAGIAFDATLWAIQAGTHSRKDHSLWAEAIHFVRRQETTGRKVIILEIQTEDCGNIEMILTIRTEIIEAIADNIVVCVPAGNGNSHRDAGIDDHGERIPYTGSILVGATKYDSQRNIKAYSNGGCRVVVYAPGDMGADLTCSDSTDTYRNGFGGTSGAVAKVAGTVALMLEKNPNLTHEQVRDILSRSEIPVVDDVFNQVGVLLDAEQAVSEALKRAG